MTSATSQAIATRNEQVAASPRKLVEQYTGEFASLLPTHVKSEMFVRASAGALRKGRMTNGEFDLEIAARSNPQAFISALREAARLGLTPGSEEYYLTTVKVKGRPEILGIVGYQGYIELMYRSGAVSTVIVDTVHEDEAFEFVRGRDDYPTHIVDWRKERKGLELAYGYAKFKDGAYSNVVVLNQFDIDKIKAKSASYKSGSDMSPWRTDERAMWLKSVVRRLKTWVPTSTELRTAIARAEYESRHPGILIPDVPHQGAEVPLGHQVVINDPDDVVEGELQPEDAPAEQAPVVQEAAPAAAAAAEPEQAQPATEAATITKAGVQSLKILFGNAGFSTPESQLEVIKNNMSVTVTDLDQLTTEQSNNLVKVLNVLNARRKAQAQEAPGDDEPPADDAR